MLYNFFLIYNKVFIINFLVQAKHATGNHSWGIDGESGTIVDMHEYGIWEPHAVKVQTIKTAIEV